MVTSRSVAQHTEQMVCDFAGQNRPAFLLWQIGQVKVNSLLGLVATLLAAPTG